MSGPKQLAHRREQTGDRALERMQTETREVARRANDLPFFNGVLRSVRLTAATSKKVDHGLGVAAAFIIVRQNYDGTVTQNPAKVGISPSQAGVDLANQLAVFADINCVVDLWFYPVASEAAPR